MRPRSIGVALALLTAFVAACGRDVGTQPTRLLVVVVVDQMRADYLTRFSGDFDSGLARLLDGGAVFENVHHAHAVTATGPGHATLASGAHPSRHGIVGNTWWERAERARVGCVDDPGTRLLDRTDETGASPHRLRIETLGDWLQRAAPGARVWSVALKDRSAVTPAGLRPSGVFWYDWNEHRFVSSDFYLDAEPEWVTAFAERGVERYGDRWELLDDPATYARAAHDDATGETPPATFPHRFEDGEDYYDEFATSPYADLFTLEFAERLIEAEELGRDDTPDLLFVGLSAADLVGHAYGPSSLEVEDYYRRLDRMLGDFLDRLDAAAGSGRWLVALSADHGVVPLPERSRDEGRDAHRHSWDSLADPAEAALAAALAADDLEPGAVELAYGNGWVFDAGDEVTAEQLRRLRERVAAALLKDGRIEDVFTWDELARDEPLERPYEQAYRRAFDPQRSPDLALRYRELDLPYAGETGTSHGSPYAYDTHVPLVFYGAGVQPTVDGRAAYSVDVAPTLAACLAIDPPAEIDGRSLDVCTPGPAN